MLYLFEANVTGVPHKCIAVRIEPAPYHGPIIMTPDNGHHHRQKNGCDRIGISSL